MMTKVTSTSSARGSRNYKCKRNILNTIVIATINYTSAFSTFLLDNNSNTDINLRRYQYRVYSKIYGQQQIATRTTLTRMSSSDSSTPSIVVSDGETKKENGDSDNYDGCGPLESLCDATLKACDALTPAIEALYRSINSNDNEKKNTKTKADDSVFTIADGFVQFLLTETLSLQQVVGNIVGEEDCAVNLTTKPYSIDDFIVPVEFESVVEVAINRVAKVRQEFFSSLSFTQQQDFYQALTAFIDPIDGTREFSSQKGGQCTVCVGFSDSRTGRPVAGVVYRPLSEPQPTWAVGAQEENFASSSLLLSSSQTINNCNGSLLTTNGRISPFLESLMEELHYKRISSGGAGNKMLMLLEGKGTAYIQDRGVSRWDTCAAQAVLEAHGGILIKLDQFMNQEISNDEGNEIVIEDEYNTLLSYTYQKTDQNLDFVPGMAILTKYNALDGKGIDTTITEHQRLAVTVSEVKPYSNLCGLLALRKSKNNRKSKAEIFDGLKRAAKSSPPAFD